MVDLKVVHLACLLVAWWAVLMEPTTVAHLGQWLAPLRAAHSAYSWAVQKADLLVSAMAARTGIEMDN